MTTQTTIAKLYTRINELATAIGTTIKGVNNSIGDVSGLSTTHKTSVVGAINELDTAIKTKSNLTLDTVRIELINDIGNPSTTSTYSSSRIEDKISEAVEAGKTAVKNSILDGAESAYDTLKEIQEIIKKDKTVAASLLESVNNRLKINEKMELTPEQKNFIAESLGFEDTDFVNTFNKALGNTSGNVVTGEGGGSIGG